MLYVAEETSGNIIILTTTGEELDPIQVSKKYVRGKKGIEGIAFLPAASLLLLPEKSPRTLITISLKGKERKRMQFDYAKDYSGLCYNAPDSTLLIVSDQSRSLFRISLDGALLEHWNTGIRQAEGVAQVDDTLFIVSDRDATLYRFEKRQ